MTETGPDEKPRPLGTHAELMQDLDVMIANAPDEEARRELLNTRAELDTPEFKSVHEEARKWSAKPQRVRSVRYGDSAYPDWIMLCFGPLSFILALYFLGRLSPLAILFAVTLAIAIWLGTRKRFVATFSTEEIRAEKVGDHWPMLRTGAIPLRKLQSTRERPSDRVLEVHGTSGEVIEIPMSVKNYETLHKTLTKMSAAYRQSRAPARKR